MSSKLISCLIKSNFFNHITLLDIDVFYITIKVVFFNKLCSIELLCKFTLKSKHHSLRRGKNHAGHGTERPFEEKRENDVEDIAIDKNATEQKKEVLMFKKDHLLLTEKYYQKSNSLVTSEGKVSSCERPEERSSKNLSNY